jgi:SAM-dependent methyltransferase
MLRLLLGLPRAVANRLLGGPPVEFQDRTHKALMIEAILHQHLRRAIQSFDLLDIGCGNGDISRHFARSNRVTGVDVKDRSRPGEDHFRFVLLDSEALPFADASFDLVLSHHVIEHVARQRHHVNEIRRVLRANGVCYLATPNKSSPIMRGHVGNGLVLRYRQMRPLFEGCGFRVVEHSTDVFVEPDRYHYPIKLGRLIPRALAEPFRFLYPSQMFILEKAG